MGGCSGMYLSSSQFTPMIDGLTGERRLFFRLSLAPDSEGGISLLSKSSGFFKERELKR
jgi:hypothetical protein